MENTDATRLLRQKGFVHIKSLQGGELWESQGVLRIHLWENTNDVEHDFKYRCETILPYQKEFFSFILPQNSEGENKFIYKKGDQIIVIEKVHRLDELNKILNDWKNLTAIIKSMDSEQHKAFQDGTIGVLPIPFTENQLDLKIADLFQRRLKQVRVLQVQAEIWTISAYLSYLGVRRLFEVKPFIFVGPDRSRLFKLIEMAEKLYGSLLLINMEVLLKDEQAHRALLFMLQHINLKPEYTGGRIIVYYGSNFRLEDNPLPLVQLPDIYKTSCRDIADKNGLQLKSSTLNALVVQINNQIPGDDAIAELADGQRLVNMEEGGAERLHNQAHAPSADIDPSKINNFYESAQAILNEHLVGHGAIGKELLNTLCTYLLLGVTKPLVLAFCGPSGCGKNHIGSIIARILHMFFNTASVNYINFNAASLVSRWGIYQLTGVQAGLKGMERGGILESLSQGSCLSVDEVDKNALDSSVQDFLLDLFETGSFRNGHGQRIQLPRCVILLTMNAGQNEQFEKIERIGFNVSKTHTPEIEYYKDFMGKGLLPALKGRIDRSFIFAYLEKEDLMEIGLRELRRYRKKIESCHLTWPIENDEAVIRPLVDTVDIKLGARGILHEDVL